MLCSATRQDVSAASAFGSNDAMAELDRILADPLLKLSDRNRRFLRFAAEEALAGRADRVKAYTIAVDVFGRSEDFDPVADPIVRIEANRLRSALRTYYSGPGQQTPIRIVLPKGSYIPVFIGPDEPPRRRVANFFRGKRPIFAAGAVLGCGLVVLGFSFASVARLPLKSDQPLLQLPEVTMMTQGPEAESTAQAIGFSLLAALSQWGALRVHVGPMEGRSATGAKAPKSPLYALETSLESTATGVRLWWKLRDSRTNEIIVADRIDAPAPQGPLHVEDMVAQHIVERLAERLSLTPPVQTAFDESGLCAPPIAARNTANSVN